MFPTARPMGLTLAALLAAPAGAIEIYDTIAAGTDGVAFVGDLVLDDLQLDGGGLLQSVTIAVTAEGGGGTVTSDVMMSLALDGGDGFPDFDGTGDDSFLFQTMMPAVDVPVGGVLELTFDVAAFYALVPEDALLFGGVQFTNPAVGHVFHGDPVVGSTSPFVFSFMAMGPVPVPSVGDPGLANSDGLSFTIDAIPLPPGSQRSAIIGDVIDFESFAEGIVGPALATGGVTFHEARDGFPPPVDQSFAIDDGTGVWDENPDMLDFVEGRLLAMNGFSGGPDGYLFTSIKSLRITPDRVRTGARLSIAHVTEILDPPLDFSTATVTLLAFHEGAMVASHSIHPDQVLGGSGGGSFTFGAGELEISGVAFDDLVLFANGPGAFGGVMMGLDRVLVGDATCLGDLDASGAIDFGDLVTLLSLWGPCADCPADLDDDGDVGFEDLLLLLSTWGPCA